MLLNVIEFIFVNNSFLHEYKFKGLVLRFYKVDVVGYRIFIRMVLVVMKIII